MARISEVILDPAEETSILLEGDFDQDAYSKNIKIALHQALAIKTKISKEIKFMPGMSGKKYRYFINNLVSLTKDSRYLEIGSWTGSSVCAALYGNEAKALCIDNWLKFDIDDKLKSYYGTTDQEKDFKINIKKVITEKIDFKFLESDFRKVDYTQVGKFNIYFYDCLHDEKSQYQAINIVQPALDNICIMIIDDWNQPEVRKATFKALKDLGADIVSKIEIKTTQNDKFPKLLHSQFSDWHNGYFISVCKKTK